MAFIAVLCILIVVAGLVARAVLAASPDRRVRRADEDVTDTTVAPPAHPTEPIPGSAPDRARHGKP